MPTIFGNSKHGFYIICTEEKIVPNLAKKNIFPKYFYHTKKKWPERWYGYRVGAVQKLH